MTMLECFFDITRDSSKLFEGLEIMQHKELCDKWMNQYPVLFISFKAVEALNFDNAYNMLKAAISGVCLKHDYLLSSKKTDSVVNRVIGNEVHTFEQKHRGPGS